MKRALLVSAVPAMLLVACSGSGADEPATSDQPVAAAVETDSAPQDTAEEAAADRAGDESIRDFCEAAAALRDAEFDDDEVFGPQARRLLEDVRASAPAGLADDVTLVLDVLVEVEQIEAAAPDSDDEETFERVLELIFSPDFEAASRSIEAFGVTECGFEPVEQPA